jgi:hypothetical protein
MTVLAAATQADRAPADEEEAPDRNPEHNGNETTEDAETDDTRESHLVLSTQSARRHPC